jgi:asparagine synthase (glutamine-hydrolysing)
MSAIGAVYNLDKKPVELSSLAKMSDCLKHRGTDAARLWNQGSIGLFHRMRWTTPESQLEKLPAKSRFDSSFITCDARIDNRAELISQLSFDGRRDDEIPDSEIILAAYRKWGEECVPRLIGDFVFAIWNEREKMLFAARDPLGVKHFYYYYQPHKIFALASEIKALFALENIPRELNEQHLGDYLVINSEDKENTFYKNIKRLPATHALAVGEKGFRIRRYWKPDTNELRLKNDGEYHEAFREKFEAAVTARLRSAYPTGSMLSGGLDSSSIVCVASEHLKKRNKAPLHTFSAVFPTIAKSDARIDETRFMRSVIAKTGCTPHYVNADDASPLKDIEKVLWHTDHPVGAPIYMDWEIFRAAQNQGVRVVLSGFDGDSTVSHGYEDLANFALRGWYLRLFREAFALRKNMPRRSHNLKRLIWHRGIAKSVPPAAYTVWRKLRGRKPEDYTPSPITFPLHFESVNSDFRKSFDLENRIIRFREENYPEGISPIEYHWNALTNGHFSQVLENLEKAAAAFEIEPRFPFFDRRLIEFCIALPPGQRIYKGWTRSIFRHAMNGIVPDDVRWRTDKSNIGASVKINLLKYGAAQLENAVYAHSHRLRKFVDIEFLKAAYADYQSAPLQKESEALLLLTTVYLINWLGLSGLAEQKQPGLPAEQAAGAAAA